MGRHSGARCRACDQLVRVRDDRLVEHEQQFPALGTSLTCVGSHARAVPDAAPDESRGDAGEAGARVSPEPSARHRAAGCA